MIRNPGLWLGVFSAAFVLTLIVGDMGRTSPGPLATVHERHPDLSGGRGCNDCHGGWTRSMTESCLDCHAAIAEHLETGDGLHGSLEDASTCALCHSEHHGPDFPVVNAQSFAAAGVPDPDAFDHRRVGFVMEGAHLEAACVDCHEHVGAAVLPEGAHRYLGLVQDCQSCHDDPHEDRYELSCLSCHGQVAFDELASEGHDEFLPLAGAHGSLACGDCHAETGAHSLDFLGTGRRRAQPRDCADCHESPHRDGFLEGVARSAGATGPTTCARCHEPSLHESFRDGRLAEMTRAEHALTGFLLNDPHDEAACADCHTAPRAALDEVFEARYPGRAADDCAACHEDPHEGQFDTAPLPERGCLACHERHTFEPHTFGLEEHARVAMPLTGSHEKQDCNACHVVEDEGHARLFRGTPAACAACHADAHGGFFDERAASAAPAEGGQCALCHRPSTFREPPPGGFDHEGWTGFAVVGAHAQADCETCHPRSHEPDELGRTFGRVAEHFGVHEGCVTCHADPHRGMFDRERLPAEVDGRTGCARCHDQTSFRSFPRHFFHNMWTGFPLIGAHREIDCSSCHPPLGRPDDVGRTWAAAKGAACQDCHVDPHVGQFRLESGDTDCGACHASAHGWGDLAFEHDEDSRFPIDEQHASVSCDACHEPWPLADGREVVRYRPLSTRCFDCHGVPEEELRRRARER